jgi:hypothetical protein
MVHTVQGLLESFKLVSRIEVLVSSYHLKTTDIHTVDLEKCLIEYSTAKIQEKLNMTRLFNKLFQCTGT